MTDKNTAEASGTFARFSQIREPIELKPGMFLAESLVTDTIVYEITKVTPKGCWIRKTKNGETIERDARVDNNAFPVIWTEQVPDPDAPEKLIRIRKRGWLKLADWGSPLGLARTIENANGDKVPAKRTDYRF